mmetsp:Transcript_87605/g.107370  ORF Transcript_87605/g.107370 Transcript_87605/m.107370 type:complete len:106 (-) Transcript_87605:92-409(-)
MAEAVTKEQLQKFFERAEQAEKLASTLAKQIKIIRERAAPEITGTIDAKTKSDVIKKLKELKNEVSSMETKIINLENENKKLTQERDGLAYRVKHMKSALEQYKK